MGKVTVAGGKVGMTAPKVLPVIGTALSDCTPEEIQMVAQEGLASNYWSVGDTVPIILNGTVGAITFSNETYYAIIIGFDHNSSVEGKNTIHFQFGKTNTGKDIAFSDSDYRKNGTSVGFRMNTSVTNAGGWKSCYMRSTICPAFKSAMPLEWQSVIATCTKYSDNNGGTGIDVSYVTATPDEIFCLSEFEVQGSRTYANTYEQNYQKQYDYYKSGNSKIKYPHSSTSSNYQWWLRSVNKTYNNFFCATIDDGSSAGNSANMSLGFAPGFMVA